MKITVALTLAAGLLLWGPPLGADVWDIQSDPDNGLGTDNELVAGSDQLHDLGALPGPTADQDWYAIGQKPYSSYEVVVDGTSGDIGYGCEVARVDGTGAILQQCQSITPGRDYSRSLRWANSSPDSVNGQFVRVTSAWCTTNCGADDQYRIRFYDTTMAIPRFNNSGTQVTMLLLQNTGDAPIAGNVFYFSAAGTPLASQPINIAARGMVVISTVLTVPAQSGAVLIAHNGRYGWLVGKAVALEPSTGFTFDTAAVPRIQ